MRAAPMAYNFYLYELENSSNEFWLEFFVFHAENSSILQMSEIHFHFFCIFFVAKIGHLHIFGSS